MATCRGWPAAVTVDPGWNVPSLTPATPWPSRIETVPVPPFATARSAMPSPFKSAIATLYGYS